MREIRPQGFGQIPIIVKNLIIVNALALLAQYIFSRDLLPGMVGPVEERFAMFYYQSELFKPWQLLTYMFLHANIPHIFFNMLGLYFCGTVLEQVWGPRRFLFFYLVCGLGAAVAHQFSQFYGLEDPGGLTVGASGAVFGCLAAFAYLFPNTRVYIYFFMPMRAKWFALIYVGLELMYAVTQTGGAIAHWAHLGGALVGFVIVFIWNKTNRQTFY